MRNIGLLTLLLCLYALPLGAVTYSVSTSGDDDWDGLTPETAWRTPDNGDIKGVLGPGDTVLVMPGLYLFDRSYGFTTSGTAASPVVYTGTGSGTVAVRSITGTNAAVRIRGDNVEVHDFNVSCDVLATLSGIEIDGDSCLVTECEVHEVYYDGIKVNGHANTILKNVVWSCGEDGIACTESASTNRFYANTVYDNDANGMQILGAGNANRTFNNIIVLNEQAGITGEADNVCGFNDVWSNVGGEYGGGAADSSGGISEDPLFVNSPSDFNLEEGSPAIDAGLDLGYPYLRTAPDMGALESDYPTTYYVSPTGDDDADGLTPGSAWLSIDNGDRKGILVPGDTVNVLPGTYLPTSSITLDTDGTPDSNIVYRRFGEGDVVIDCQNGSFVALELDGNHATVNGLEITNTQGQGVQVTSDSCTVAGFFVHDISKVAFVVRGSFNLFLRNIVAFCDQEGFKGEGLSQLNLYYNNTIYSNGKAGIQLINDNSRVFNNIYALNERGIVGTEGNVCGFNNVWGNVTSDWFGGVFDSAGGISAEPGLVDPSGGDFGLMPGALEIDAGLDLGYPFMGYAPDIGAVESDSSDTLAYLVISPDTATVVEGLSLQFNVGGYSVDSVLVIDLTDHAVWSTDDPSGSMTLDGLYTAGHEISPPDYHVVAAFGALSDSALVTVTSDGTLSYIRVELADGTPFPDTTLSTDNDTTTVYCRGYDSGDNPLGDWVADWEIVGDPVGSPAPQGAAATTLTLTTPGTCRLAAEATPAIKDTSGVITCVAGEPWELVVSPDEATVSADSTRLFASVSYDADGNVTSPQVEVAWEVLGGIGTIDGSGLFTAVTVGMGKVAASGAGLADTTGIIEVVPGEVCFINVSPTSQVVIEGSSYQFNASGFDADSNPVGDVTSEATWSTTDPSGHITGEGLYTAGNDPSPPIYHVIAKLDLPLGSLRTVSDSSEVTVISSGLLNYVRVESKDGQEFADTILSADNDTTMLYCRGYDSADSLIGAFAAAWSVIGDDSVGSVDEDPVAQTRLALRKEGLIRVVATYTPEMADTTGFITCVAGIPARLVISPDTATVTAGETLEFGADTFDADWNPVLSIPVDEWGLVGEIGSIAASGVFTATTAGAGQVTCAAGGLADTTGTIDVIPAVLCSLEVSPDSIEVDLGESLTFAAQGWDAYGNITDLGDLAWDVVGDIGEIDQAGLFTALAVGTGRVSATSNIGGVTDTNRVVRVNPSDLEYMLVAPDTATVKVSGQVLFSAYGFDAEYDPVTVPDPVWEVVGGIGTIDQSGWFTATDPGVGKIAATALNGMSDTTDMIVVQVPTIDEIAIGHKLVHAGETGVPVLSFKISNAFDGRETLEGITVRDASRGAGSRAEVASNIDSLILHMDADESLGLSPGDVVLSTAPMEEDSVNLSFPPVSIGPGAQRAFFVSLTVSESPRDGDSLDLYLLPAWDIAMAGGTPVAGPDTVNSLGCNIIDGLIASQVRLIATGLESITPQDGISNVMIVDIPRNGYSEDVLKIFSVFNAGSADTVDIDSLFLYRDDGDGAWGSAGEESRVGTLRFTGDQWEVSGLAQALTAPVTRFFLGATVSPRASNGSTLALGIPLHGLEMASGNDGPMDQPVPAAETIGVSTPEMVSVRVIEIPGRDVIPGTATGPLLGIEVSNGYGVPVAVDTLKAASAFHDEDGVIQALLDAQVEWVGLWMNLDGDYSEHTSADSLVASAELSEGLVSFPTPGVVIAPGGGRVELFIECGLDLEYSKDSNTVGFVIPTSSDICFQPHVSVSGDFPLTNEEEFPIEAFPAARVGVFTVPGATVFGNRTDLPVLDLTLPRNGYSDDDLVSMRVRNTGTTAGNGAISAVRLWIDDGEEGFSGDDIMLGMFAYRQGGLWEIQGLSVPVSQNGKRFLVTADVGASGFEGGTARFELPLQGAEYASGMDGPDDQSVGNSESYFLFPANRITVIPIPREPASVVPGTSPAQILTFALYNGYPEQTHLLREVRLSNDTRTLSSAEFADFELGQVSLFYDQNSSRAFDDDSLLAAGYFDNANLGLSGLDIALPPESLAYFFVTANLPVAMIDSDTLAITIQEPSDFTFTETANINGEFPVSRGGVLLVDGSVRIQYSLLDVESHTVSPGDQSVPVLAFRPAANGDLTDVLDSLSVINLGDASPDDISSLRLYLDTNQDETWQPGDMFVGDATYLDGCWRFGDLALEIDAESEALMVVATISDTATSGKAVRAAVPVDGCIYASSNDGPRDVPLASGQTFAISTSIVKVTYDNLDPTYSVGQDIELGVRVTNLLSVPISGVTCEVGPAEGGDLVHLKDAFTGPADLGPNQTLEFYADYTAVAEGETYWRIRAFSADPQESSGVVLTEPVVIQSAPTHVGVEMLSSIPTAVTRGQTRVFPLSIRYSHSSGSPLTASVRLDSLRIHIEDETGAAQFADEVFSRLVLATGYTNLAVVDSPPHSPAVSLVFSQPALLPPGQEQVISLRVDIDSSATALSFALVLENEGDLRFTDCNTDASIPIAPEVTFPLKTASCRVSNPSHSLGVSYLPVLEEAVNRGQRDVDMIRLVLRHPGQPNDSQIQFTKLSFKFVDHEQIGITPSGVFESVTLVSQQTVVGEVVPADMGSEPVTARLTAPPVVSPGDTDTLKIRVSVRPDASQPSFGMVIQDSTWLELRDLSSGAVVEAVSDHEVPAPEGVFPMWSGAAFLMAPADDPEICPSSNLPASLIAGSDSVGLMEISVRHPGVEDQSPFRLDKVRLAVTDSSGVPLDPRLLFDRIGVRIEGGPATYQEFIAVEGGYTVFDIGDKGLVVGPGVTSLIGLVADVEAETPFEHFMLRWFPENGLAAVDNTDRRRGLGVSLDASCPAAWPFATGLSRIFLPAGSPVIKRYEMGSRIAYPGQTGVEFFSGEITYRSSGPQADLVLDSVRGQVLRRTGRGLEEFPAGDVFDAVYLLADGVSIACDTVLAGDSVDLHLDSEYIISRETSRSITLTCDIASQARQGNYLITFNDSTFMSLVDHDLQTGVSPVLAGMDYPMTTGDISITAESLSGSLVNWPNPFNPDKEITRLGFVLPQSADVDIEIFSITGDLVRTLVLGAPRPQGSNDQDTWDGKNDQGQMVLPGTYFCRIKAEYPSGGSDQATRRVAVVR